MSWRSERHARLGAVETDGRRWRVRAPTPEALPGILAALDGEPWRPSFDGGEPAGDDGWIIDLSGLDGVRSVAPESGVAHVEAGCRWSALERKLADRGLTVGPVPRWLAERAIGETLAQPFSLRPSPRYGDPRDGLLALRTALPSGLTACAVSPRRATGPDLGRVPVGADHRAGLLADVHLRVWPRDDARAWRRLRFRGWNEARAAAMALWTDGLRPAWWCLRRARREVALELELHGPRIEGQLERLDAVIDGLAEPAKRDLDQTAADWGAECFGPGEARTLTPLKTVQGADLAAALKGITKAEVWDLRPEGATVYVPRDAEPPAPDAGWSALAERVFAALADGSR